MVDDLDRVLMRLAAVSAPAPIGDDPGFLDRLRRSGEREVAFGLARSAVLGLVVAGAVLVAGVARAPHGADAGFLYATASGQLL